MEVTVLLPAFGLLTLGIQNCMQFPIHGNAVEGKDYFYDEAIGKNVSCPDFCDLPTQYPVTCKEKCEDYQPQYRTTPAPPATVIDVQTRGPGAGNGHHVQANSQMNYIPFVVAAICVLVLVVTLLVIIKCCGGRLKTFLARIRERLCERLVDARQEQGAREFGEGIVSLQPNQTLRKETIRTEHDPQTTETLL